MRVVPPLTGHLDMALSNFIKGYRNNEFVGDLLFPRLEVTRQTDVFWVFGKENLQLTEKTLRAPGAPAQETRFTASTSKYFAQSRALKSNVADEDRAAYTIGDLDMDSADTMMQKLLLDREIRQCALATTAANYSAANTLALSGTSKWSDTANSDPIAQINAAKKQIRRAGVNANTLILADDVFDAASNHPKLIDRVKYTKFVGSLDEALLATAFGVDRVVRASAVMHDGNTGNFIWSGVAVLAYIPPSVGAAGVIGPAGQEGLIRQKQLSFGKTFTWVNAPMTVGGYGVVISRHPDATAKADIVGVDWYTDEQITGSDVGYLLTSVL